MNQETIEPRVESGEPQEREYAQAPDQTKAHRPLPAPAPATQWTPPATPIPAMQQAAELLAAAPVEGPFGERPEPPNAAAIEQARQMLGPGEPATAGAGDPAGQAPDGKAAVDGAPAGGQALEVDPAAPAGDLVAAAPAPEVAPAPAPAARKGGGGGGGGAPAPEAGAVDVDAPLLLDDGDAEGDDDEGPPEQIEADDVAEEVQDAADSDDGAIEDLATDGDGDDDDSDADAPEDDDAGDGDDLDEEDADDDAGDDPDDAGPAAPDAPAAPVAEALAAEIPVAPDYTPAGGGGGGGALVDPPEPEPVDVSGDTPEAGLGKLAGKRPDVVANALGGMGESVKAAVAGKRDALKAAPPTSKSLTGPKEGVKAPGGDAPLPDKAAPVQGGGDVPTPEPAPAPAPQAPPAANQATAPALKGGGEGGKLDKGDVAKMEAGLNALPTSDPALTTDPGPPPPVQLAGSADPAAAKATKGQLDAQLAHLKQSGARDVAAPRPDENIPTTIPDAEVVAQIPESTAAGGADLTSLQADGTLGKMAAEIEPETIDAAIGKAQGDLVEKKKAQADEEQQLRLDAQKTVDQLQTDARADQDKQRADAKAAIGQARAQWKKDLDKTHGDAKIKADAELTKGLKAVSDKKTSAEKEAAKHLSDGEKQAADARREGEKQAQAHKADGQKQKSGFWGWVASKAKAFFDGIKKKITDAINWAREKVKQAIEWAKKAAQAAIEKARKWIVDKIKAVGEALKAIGDVVLAAYPELREKFRRAIDEKVAAATKAVNDAAKKLEKGITAALDGLGKAIDKGLALLEKGLHMLVDGVGAVVQGVIDNARKIAEALGTFAVLFVDVSSNPLGWIKNLGAAVVSGIKNHLWGAFQTAVKAWFQQKLMEVLGIGGVIIKLLISEGGLTMEKIGQMTWDALKAMIPAALIGILVTRLVSMIVPAAGAVLAIIEGLQAAWGTISRIITAIDLFMTFLKAVKSGQAAKPFAEALAAAGVVVLDFIANWLLKKLGPAGRGVGKKFKSKAKGLKGKQTLKAKGKSPKPKAKGKTKGKPNKSKTKSPTKGKKKPTKGKGKKKDKNKQKDQALVKRAAQKAAGKAWSKAKAKAGKQVVKQAALDTAIKSAGGRVSGATVTVKVVPSGTSWKVTATAKKKGRVATASKGKGWVATGEKGGRWFTVSDLGAFNKKLIKDTFAKLKKAEDKAKEKGGLKAAYDAKKKLGDTLEKKAQSQVDRKAKGLKVKLEMEAFAGVETDKKIKTKMVIAPNMSQDVQDIVIQGFPYRVAKVEADSSVKVVGAGQAKTNAGKQKRPPMLSAKEKLPGFVVNMTAMPDSVKPTVVERYAVDAWKGSTRELGKQRTAVVVGVNSFKSIDADRNQKKRTAITKGAAGVKSVAEVGSAVFGFLWEPKWEKDGKPVQFDTVARAFGKLKSEEKKSAYEQSEGSASWKAGGLLPYGVFRNTVIASKHTRMNVSRLSKIGFDPVHVLSQDDDGQISTASGSGLIAEYDKVLSQMQKQPVMTIGGYRFSGFDWGPDATSRKAQLTELANAIDRAVRVGVGELFADVLYPTEPNMLIKATDKQNKDGVFDTGLVDKKGGLFGVGTSEGRAAKVNILDKHGPKAVKHAPSTAIPTSPDPGDRERGLTVQDKGGLAGEKYKDGVQDSLQKGSHPFKASVGAQKQNFAQSGNQSNEFNKAQRLDTKGKDKPVSGASSKVFGAAGKTGDEILGQNKDLRDKKPITQKDLDNVRQKRHDDIENTAKEKAQELKTKAEKEHLAKAVKIAKEVVNAMTHADLLSKWNELLTILQAIKKDADEATANMKKARAAAKQNKQNNKQP